MKKFLTTLAVLTAFAAPAFAQSFDPDAGTGNVLSFVPTPTAPHDHKILPRQSSPWFRDGARFSIRKVQQIRAVAASATTKCSVASESDEENRAALACPLSICLAGNSRVLRNVAETMKDYANEVARHPRRVDVGAYLRC
jgi:hypothetical protein